VTKRIGIDVGGTFTDAVLWDENQGLVASAKVLSNNEDPVASVLASVRKLEPELSEADSVGYLVHGTTVATNASLEGSGPRLALLCTQGFRDVLEIGRLVRPPEMIYDLRARRPMELVKRRDRFEIPERLDHRGKVVCELDEAAVVDAARTIRRRGIKSVAVSFLYSYMDSTHERQARAILRRELPGISISLSSEVLPEFREYERTSTTTLNAYLAPIVSGYLTRLEGEVRTWRRDPRLWIMQSNGGVTTPSRAAELPVTLLLSGPSGGAVAGKYVADHAGLGNAITIDMGGTSFDVCLLAGNQLPMTQERKVMDLPVRVPSVDILTIGTGGGSLAWVDKGGQFRVGPKSAGARPGPVAYGRGGSEATVTDANVVLGVLGDGQRLAGEVELDAAGAHKACEALGKRLGMSAVEVAWGIRRIVNAAMAGAVRAVSVGRGHDPRDFALIAFGGAGPMHAIDIAAEIGVTMVLVPWVPGCHSALGMVVTDVAHDYSVTSLAVVKPGIETTLQSNFAALEVEAHQDLDDDGIPSSRRVLAPSLDLRYQGQHSSINLPAAPSRVAWLEDALSRFHREHERLYGYMVPDETVEIVNAKLRAIGRLADGNVMRKSTATAPTLSPQALEWRSVYFGPRESGWHRTPVYDRLACVPGSVISGPAIVQQQDSTFLVPPGARGHADSWGNLVVSREEP
jgi:N-methylhydantoinase A